MKRKMLKREGDCEKEEHQYRLRRRRLQDQQGRKVVWRLKKVGGIDEDEEEKEETLQREEEKEKD